MHKILACKIKQRILCKIIFCIQLFLFSCSRKDEIKPEAFLKQFLLEEGAIYTLAGSKPITDLLIYIGSEQEISLEDLSSESLQDINYVENEILENWRSWKNFSKNLKLHNFKLIERDCRQDPLYTMYSLVNVENLRNLLLEYHSEFCTALEKDFEVERVIYELDDPQSTFWNLALSNHYTSGLLHGYGKENSLYFLDVMNGKAKPYFPESFEGPVTQDHFPLPVFAIGPNEKMVKKYQKERDTIKKAYRKEKFFQKSLKLLQSKS